VEQHPEEHTCPRREWIQTWCLVPARFWRSHSLPHSQSASQHNRCCNIFFFPEQMTKSNHNDTINKSIQRLQTSANAKISTKSDPRFECGFWIKLDPDVCWICPKMLWMHYLVGVSHFANIVKSATDCMRNANKCSKIPYSAMVKKMKKWSRIYTVFSKNTHICFLA